MLINVRGLQEALEQFKAKTGMSIPAVANVIRVSPETVGNWGRAKRGTTIRTQEAFVAAFRAAYKQYFKVDANVRRVVR